jgi:hypothetical protein
MLFSWLIPKAVQTAFNAPTQSEYVRRDDPGTRVVIRTADSKVGGMSDAQSRTLNNALDVLPVSHVRSVGLIGAVASTDMTRGKEAGHADEAGVITLNTDGIGPGHGYFQLTLMHEIGHEVEFHAISKTEREEWKALHDQSNKRSSFVSAYAMTKEEEDFADTYAKYTTDTAGLALEAATEAQNGATEVLQKYLYMAALFTNDDGSVKTYALSQEGMNVRIPLALPEFQAIDLARVAHYRTNEVLAIGAYTYQLRGDSIVAITDESGKVIVDNLDVPVPKTLLEKWNLTRPPPGVAGAVLDGEEADSNDLDPLNAELGKFSVGIASPEDPTVYTPLSSRAGYAAIAGEQAMADRNHRLTLRDQMRPHADARTAVPLP